MSALPGTTGRRRIYLIRHGHVDYFGAAAQALENVNHVPLTDLGQEQAAAAAQALSHVKFDRVIHSGLPRTDRAGPVAPGWSRSGTPTSLGGPWDCRIGRI